MPDLEGKVAIVTGANTGLGFKTTLELAKRNANVVLASRNRERTSQAIEKIEKEISGKQKLDFIQLDLASYDSIKQFADTFIRKYDRLDILMNNAGVVNSPERIITNDGNEAHFGVNHLGHFLLTGLLLDTIMSTPKARVVNVTSGAFQKANINIDDLEWSNRNYDKFQSYADSKLANLLFTLKLQQYFQDNSIDALAISAHPGLTASPRQKQIGTGGRFSDWLVSPLEKGVRPQLLAATASLVKPADFWGPKFGLDGSPRRIKINHEQYNQQIADRLWNISQEKTDLKFGW